MDIQVSGLLAKGKGCSLPLPELVLKHEFQMETQGKKEKRKTWDKVYYEKHCKTKEKKEAKNKRQKERRERKKLEERMVDERFLRNQKKLQKLQMSLKKETQEQSMEVAHSSGPENLQEEKSAPSSEEVEKFEFPKDTKWDTFEAMAENFLSNAKSVKSLTSLTLDEFESLEKEN